MINMTMRNGCMIKIIFFNIINFRETFFDSIKTFCLLSLENQRVTNMLLKIITRTSMIYSKLFIEHNNKQGSIYGIKICLIDMYVITLFK